MRTSNPTEKPLMLRAANPPATLATSTIASEIEPKLSETVQAGPAKQPPTPSADSVTARPAVTRIAVTMAPDVRGDRRAIARTRAPYCAQDCAR